MLKFTLNIKGRRVEFTENDILVFNGRVWVADRVSGLQSKIDTLTASLTEAEDLLS